MKTWAADNPKAKLLKRKREAILAAARRQFLKSGYGGASMEAVAADAGVSIMTLYRHAESKDDLFAAVVGIACHPEDEAAADLSGMGLSEILVATGIGFREKLMHADTLALLRAVIAEQGRFPDLAGTAYEATVGHVARFVEELFAARPEFAAKSKAERKAIAARFVDDLLDADTLKALFGLAAKPARDHKRRAEIAAARVLSELGL